MTYIKHTFPLEALLPALLELAEPILDSDLALGEIRRTYQHSSHPDTRVVYLVVPKNFLDYFTCKIGQVVETAAASRYPSCMNLVRQALNLLNLPEERLGYVMLAMLPPGGIIKPHIDGGDYAARTQRYHIVLTEEGSTFGFGEDLEDNHFGQGSLIQFPHRVLHAGWNNGTGNRIDIIFDVFLPVEEEQS